MSTNFELITTAQLEKKLNALIYYEKCIRTELEKRGKTIPVKSVSTDDTKKQIPLNIKSGGKKVKKIKIQKKSKNKNEDKSGKTIKASVIAMRNVLDKNGVKYLKSHNKTELSNLLRKNCLIRVAESEHLKLKKKKK